MPEVEPVELCHYPTPQLLARAAAERWLGSSPHFRYVALSGGRIAREFLAAVCIAAVADPTFAGRLRQTHFFWADERCVPPEHPESNYGIAKEMLFDPLRFPDACIHRLKGEWEPHRALLHANDEIQRVVPVNDIGLPALDLVLLGMGEDGHVASLFPGDATGVSQLPYCVVVGPKPPNPRLTLTYAGLSVAKEAWVLVSGGNKAEPLRNSLSGKGSTPLLQLVRLRQRTVVFVDGFILNASPGAEVENCGN